MNTIIPRIDVFYNHKSLKYLLQSYMLHPQYGYSMASGGFVVLSLDDMKENGLTIILSNLHGFQDRSDFSPSPFEGMAANQRRSFVKSHSNVLVTLLSSKLVLTPMCSVGNQDASEGDPSREITLEEPFDADLFIKSLNMLLNV